MDYFAAEEEPVCHSWFGRILPSPSASTFFHKKINLGILLPADNAESTSYIRLSDPRRTMGCTQGMLAEEIEQKYRKELNILCLDITEKQKAMEELNTELKSERARRVEAEKMKALADAEIQIILDKQQDLELQIEEFNAEQSLHRHANDTIIGNISSQNTEILRKYNKLKDENEALRHAITENHSETGESRVVLDGMMQKIRLSHVLRSVKRSERHVLVAETNECCYLFWGDRKLSPESHKGVIRRVYKQDDASSYISDEEVTRMLIIETMEDKVVHFLADSQNTRNMWYERIVETMATKTESFVSPKKRHPESRNSVME